MKKLFIGKILMLVLLLILIAFITKTYLFSKNEYGQEVEQKKQTLEQDVRYTKKLFQGERLKFDRVVESISKELEIIVLKEIGNIQLFHDKTPENNKYIEWFIDSNITFRVYYTTILTIDAKGIEVCYDEITDRINIIYSLEEINVRSVNIDNILSKTSKGIFGKQYSEKEVNALTLLATDKIKEKILNDSETKFLASINLEEYLRNIAYELGIFNINIIQK